MSPNPTEPTHESALATLHREAEAETQAYDDIEIVSTFGEPQAEYAALHKSCGLVDLAQRAVCRVGGADRIEYLNRFLTNGLVERESKTPIAEGAGVYSFLLNTKGRVVADMNVLERGDHTLIETDARLLDGLIGNLDRYLFTDDVTFDDARATAHRLGLFGPGAFDVVREATGLPLASLRPLASVAAQIDGRDVLFFRDDWTPHEGLQLIVNEDDAVAVWTNLIERFGVEAQPGRRRLRPVGWAAFNAARVEAGRRVFGIDFDDTVLPHETGAVHRAVSFDKGCYVGQEVVARMEARKVVARQVVGLRVVEPDALPVAGAPVLDAQQNIIGGITSSTVSPVLSNAAIALALIKRPHFEVGTTLLVPADGTNREATVVETPFVSD